MQTRPRYREGDPEPEDTPAPTQARADFIKARTHGAEVDDIPAQLPPQNQDVPYVGGTAQVGGTLNCTMGNWTGEPDSYAYAWASDGAPVVAGGSDYIVEASDVGHAITCVVTATNAHGSTAAPPSNAVAIA